jgi:hypothetical protein
MKAYIISYFGNRDKADTRHKRYLKHCEQVEWWQTQYPTMTFDIVAMDYDSTEYIDNANITYINNPVVHPSAARNILLKRFYNDNPDEWALFMDNDVIQYHHIDWPHTHIKMCDILEQYPNNFTQNNVDITLIQPSNPGRPGDGAFNAKYSNQDLHYAKADWQNNLYFDRTMYHLKGTMFWLRKHPECCLMDEEHYAFDEQGKLIPMEDVDFCLNLTHNHRYSYICRNIMIYEWLIDSTWVEANDDANRSIENNKQYAVMSEKYNMPLDKSVWHKHFKRNGLRPPKQFITPYTHDRQPTVFEQMFTQKT